jgi:hypothetical protein
VSPPIFEATKQGWIMRYFLALLSIMLFFIGCSNTWHGIKEDTNDAYEWSKEKINSGASYIKEKTE